MSTNNNTCLNCHQNDEFHFTLSQCKHCFCWECLSEYLEGFTSCNIVCPSEGCSKLIPDNIIRTCLSNVQLELYDDYCLPSTAVRCRIEGCSGIVVSRKKKGHFECPVCEQPNCLSCSNLHLGNEPCGVSLDKKRFEEIGANKLRERRRLELIQIQKDSSVTLNPEKSECGICSQFLLPRQGIFVMPCMHMFCRKCLQKHLNNQRSITFLTCPAENCTFPLENSECRELMEDFKLNSLCIKAVSSNYYNCKTPDCVAYWDPGDVTGIINCQICKKDNCISCAAVHEGQSCHQYKQSDNYKTFKMDEKFATSQKVITCWNCRSTFIKSGGCGAMKCKDCNQQVCAFLGTKLGPNGCKCRNSQKCHPDCNLGCRPEGKGKVEDELNNYYNKN